MEIFKFWLTISFIAGSQNIAKIQISTPMNASLESKGLRTTIYKVDDLEKAKTWYSKAFGLSPYFDQPFYVGFNIEGYELGLLPEKVQGPKTTNVLSYWGVDDITDAYDKMITNGAKELETPNDVGEGIKVALVKDPWDNVIGLIYNPYFKLSENNVKSIVEWVPFRLKKGIKEIELMNLASKLQNEFLIKQPGFIKRELLKKSEIEWVDLLYWKDHVSAEAATAASQKSTICAEYFSIRDLDEDQDEASLEHLEIVSQY